MSWPTEKNVARRHIIYQYQSNAICTENYLDLSRQGVGPSGHAFQYSGSDNKQIKGTPSFNVATPDIVRPAFESWFEGGRDRWQKAPNPYQSATANQLFEPTKLYPTDAERAGGRRLAPVPGLILDRTKCISHECAKLPYVPHNQQTNGYNGCTRATICRSRTTEKTCETTQDNVGQTNPTYCVWVQEKFDEMKWPKPYGNGFPEGHGYKKDGKTNANLLDGADVSGTTKRLVATTTQPTETKGTWAWIGATRFCAATNTLMHWISQQTLDIPESEHFIKQEAWCNVLEESIIHESIKTTEKREMGALLQNQCDQWDLAGTGCETAYSCKAVTLQQIGSKDTSPPYQVQAFGLPQGTSKYLGGNPGQDNRTTFGNPLFGNRYAVADVAQGYGQQNIAKMITSPTQLVAWLALAHLGIDNTDLYGDSYDASVSRFQSLSNNDAMIAATLMNDLAGAFHYDTNTFVGGWQYGDRNWNNADGTFTYKNAQEATGSNPATQPTWFNNAGGTLKSDTEKSWPYNDKHGPLKQDTTSNIWNTFKFPKNVEGGADVSSNGVLPWNTGEMGHGTVKHEEQLRKDVVAALRSEEKLAKYFSGLIADPDKNALSKAITDVTNDWGLYQRIRDKNEGGNSLAQDETTASYAAFSDFAFNFKDGEDMTSGITNPGAAAAWYKINNRESDSIDPYKKTARSRGPEDPAVDINNVFDASSVQEAIREIQESAFRQDDVDTLVHGKNQNKHLENRGIRGTQMTDITAVAAQQVGATNYDSPVPGVNSVTGTFGVSPNLAKPAFQSQYASPNQHAQRIV